MLRRLPPPLGLQDGASPVYSLSELFYIPSHGGKCHYVETLSALIRHAHDTDVVDEEMGMTELLLEFMREDQAGPLPLKEVACSIAAAFPSLLQFKDDDDDVLRTYASMKMQATMRGHHQRMQPEKSKGTKRELAKMTSTHETTSVPSSPVAEIHTPVRAFGGDPVTGESKGASLAVVDVDVPHSTPGSAPIENASVVSTSAVSSIDPEATVAVKNPTS